MEMIEYVKLVTAFIVSIGGSSVVIIALSKWFGNFLSTRLLDAYNNKHEKECKHSKKCTFYTLRFGCSFAAVNTIKPQLL